MRMREPPSWAQPRTGGPAPAAAAEAVTKAKPSGASLGPFQSFLAEKNLDITEPVSTTPATHRPGGPPFSLRAPPFHLLWSSYWNRV